MQCDQIEYKKTGMDDFLEKPIRAVDLNQVLSKYQNIA